jgi:hypothetical protein
MNRQGSIENNFSNTTAMVRAALAARSSWLSQRDRSSASHVFEAARTQPRERSLELTAKVIVPEDTITLLLSRVDTVCASFSEMFDAQADGVKYGDDDIDQACKALPVRITEELSRIVSLNGSIPAPHLDILYGRAKHIAVHL